MARVDISDMYFLQPLEKVELKLGSQFSSVQFSHSVVSDSLWPHELQHAKPPCPSPTAGVYPDLCPLSQWVILCRPLLLLPSVFSNIRVFSNESALRIMWPKYWSFSFNISPSNEHPGSQQMFNDSNKLMWVKANLCFPLMYLETEFQNKASPVLYVI